MNDQNQKNYIHRLIKKNKSAKHNYEIIEKYRAGIVLKGHEVKSIKDSHVSIKEASIRVNKSGDARVFRMSVPLYQKASKSQIGDYDPKRERKILLKKSQLAKLWEKTHQGGYNIIILNIYENTDHLIKLTIALAQKKKKRDKRMKKKKKDIQRQTAKDIKRMGY